MYRRVKEKNEPSYTIVKDVRPLTERPIAYRALAAALRERLAVGAFGGDRLPTEAELASAHGVSRQTVRRALQDLVAEGVVRRVPGRGTFATTLRPGDGSLRSFGAIEDLVAFAAGTTMETIDPLHRRLDAEAAGRLGVDGDEVIACALRRMRDGAPFCVTHVALPVAIGRLMLDHGLLAELEHRPSRTLIGVIDELWPARVGGARQSFTAEAVAPEQARHIGAEPGSPVLRVDRLFYDGDGRPVQQSVSRFNPARHVYRFEFSRG
jgi:DNA-binding GntR family transcriptional regulator